MNSSHPSGWTPTPELLAAFADGELDHRPELRHAIADWLAAHTDAAAEVEAQLELARLLGMTTPAEPMPDAWADMWSRINQFPVRRHKRWPAAVLIAGLAAAVAIIVLPLTSNPRPTSNSHPPPRPVANAGEQQPPIQVADLSSGTLEVFPVLRADEVEIIQVAGTDIATVVIGQLPLAEPVILLQMHEVEFMSPLSGDDPTEIRTGSGAIPMAWTPLPGGGDSP